MDTHIAKYRSSPNASKKPSPRRFKHDNLAQRLNRDKHTHTQSCTRTRIYTLTDRNRDKLTRLDNSQTSCPQSRFAREVDSISGVERVYGHKTKRWQFFVHFLGVCPFNCWVVWFPPKHKGERCPSRWYRLTLLNMSFAAALKTSRFFHKCIWGSQLVSCSTRQLA